jgi:hypothetical protein
MNLTAADIEADFALFDNVETVTLLQIDPDSGATTATDAAVTVLKRMEEKDEVAVEDGTSVPVVTTKFHLRASTCDFVPKERDRIVDGSAVTWVVRKVTKASFATRYICDVIRKPG